MVAKNYDNACNVLDTRYDYGMGVGGRLLNLTMQCLAQVHIVWAFFYVLEVNNSLLCH